MCKPMDTYGYVNLRNIQLSGKLGRYIILGTTKTVNSGSLYGFPQRAKTNNHASKTFYHPGLYLATIQIRVIHGLFSGAGR